MSTATDDGHQDAHEDELPQLVLLGQEERPNPRKAGKAIKFGWSLYQQVAAVFAAIGLAALISHWWQIGWRGALGSLVGFWSQTVRPAVGAVFHVLVTVPLGWVGIHFEVPVMARDYFSLGLVLFLSSYREAGGAATKSGIKRKLSWTGSLDWLRILLVAWPLVLLLEFWVLLVVQPLSGREEKRAIKHAADALQRRQTDLLLQRNQARRRDWTVFALRGLAPLIYLGVLLGVNYLVLT